MGQSIQSKKKSVWRCHDAADSDIYYSRDPPDLIINKYVKTCSVRSCTQSEKNRTDII